MILDMDLFSAMQAVLQSDLNVNENSSLFPPVTIKSALNRAYRKGGALFRWPILEDALKTNSIANQEYYDAPTIWRPDSMWRLEVDGEYYGEEPDFSPLVFSDYLDWKADSVNENSTDKKWAAQWLRYFIYPTPTALGVNNIVVWGQKNVVTLVNDGDTTIFSYSMPECNEAIVLEARAILQAKGEAEKGQEMASAEAKQILAVAFNKIRQEKSKYEKIQPML
ncbi:unnamed protein product, partial [marine sediment metagenome]